MRAGELMTDAGGCSRLASHRPAWTTHSRSLTIAEVGKIFLAVPENGADRAQIASSALHAQPGQTNGSTHIRRVSERKTEASHCRSIRKLPSAVGSSAWLNGYARLPYAETTASAALRAFELCAGVQEMPSAGSV